MQYWITVNVHWIPTFELPSSCHKTPGLGLPYVLMYVQVEKFVTVLPLKIGGWSTYMQVTNFSVRQMTSAELSTEGRFAP